MMLSPESDRTVRLAVNAFLAGELCLQLEGEILFSTRNHSYRLIDGVLFGVGQGEHGGGDGARSLLGAELVGWLHEGPDGGTVDLEWRPGARGVLVDPRRNQHIIVTSSTRTASRSAPSRPTPAPPQRPAPTPPDPGSAYYQDGSGVAHPAWAAPAPASAPPPRQPARSELRPRAPSDDGSAVRRSPVHPPPRPIRHNTIPPRIVGPLPAPVPPPRYASSAPPAPYAAEPQANDAYAWARAVASGGHQRGMRLR